MQQALTGIAIGLAMIIVARYLSRALDVVEPRAARQIAATLRQVRSMSMVQLEDAILLASGAVVIVILLVRQEFVILGWAAASGAAGFSIGRFGRRLGWSRDLAMGLSLAAYVIGRTAYAQLHDGGYSSPWTYAGVGLLLALAGTWIFSGIQSMRAPKAQTSPPT